MSKAQGKFDFSVHHPFKMTFIHYQKIYVKHLALLLCMRCARNKYLAIRLACLLVHPGAEHCFLGLPFLPWTLVCFVCLAQTMDADQNVLQKQIMRSITHCGDMFYDITLIAHT